MLALNAEGGEVGQVGQLPLFLPYSEHWVSRARLTPLIGGYFALLPY